jgi:hypothetical protein
MCTFKDERTVLVCDVAIGRVKEDLGATFDDGVRYTVVDGTGTLVEVGQDVDAARFTALARKAIAQAHVAGHDNLPGKRPFWPSSLSTSALSIRAIYDALLTQETQTVSSLCNAITQHW